MNILTSGDIIVAGKNDSGVATLAKFDGNGTPDLSFGTDGVVTVENTKTFH